MSAEELADEVAALLSVDPEEFRRRAEADAEVIMEAVEEDVFNNPQAIVGLECEFYAVKAEDGSLRRVPRRLLELIGFEKELGLHNAEMTTSPQPLNAHGLRATESEVKARLEAALAVTERDGMRLVSDALWTLPPEGEEAATYLTESIERTVTGEDGTERTLRLAANMSANDRYHAMANAEAVNPGMVVDAPNVSLEADTVMPESLITSIQPHYQVPHAPNLPRYFNYALRIAGPLLALGVNSPFFPADLYDDVPADQILEDAWMEHRISVFETVLNDPDAAEGKVRFPRDVGPLEEAVERIATDDTIVPMPVDPGTRFDDRFAHFRRKHGTYWRWIRPVLDGPTRSAANARIEFRPLPAQPTVRDTISFLAAFAGLLESLPKLDHPVIDLDWERARENFYAAMRDGLEAELAWIDEDGAEVTETVALYDDLLTHAEAGLVNRGLTEEEAAKYLYPLRRRIRQSLTPAGWKCARVRQELEDGADFPDALETMQREYVTRQRETLLEGSFADWIVE